MSGLWNSMVDGSRRLGEMLTGSSKIAGRSDTAKKTATRQRRHRAAKAGLQQDPETLGKNANRNVAFARARFGRASTILSESDRLGG